MTSAEIPQPNLERCRPVRAAQRHRTARQREPSDDVRNILNSLDLVALLLDERLDIRFATPAAARLLGIGAVDVGWPLAGPAGWFAGVDLLADARTVLATRTPLTREVRSRSGAFYACSILPYRTGDDPVQGVVIRLDDISEFKRTGQELAAARQAMEEASREKSRLLAAASHNLRQPLQVLTGLHDLLESQITGERARNLVARIGATLDSMSGMLNVLLDIDRLEAGALRPRPVAFAIGELLDKLDTEFGDVVTAQGLTWRVVRCRLMVHSDPGLLGEMLRNLLANAIRYTSKGRILLGCRRRGDKLRVEVRDTGLGIAEEELPRIFDEYYQAAGHAGNGGFGLGLAIVQRLGQLLGHPITVCSRLDKGSLFAIEVPLAR